MPGTLTLDSAAELAATLAHTSALLETGDAGYPSFTTLTPHLTDTDRRRHWDKLLDAAARQLALDHPRTGAAAALDLLDNALAADGSADDLLDLDPDLYRAVSHADRPGENDYDGYDIAALALDLATAWDTELVRRALAAVDPEQAVRNGSAGMHYAVNRHPGPADAEAGTDSPPSTRLDCHQPWPEASHLPTPDRHLAPGRRRHPALIEPSTVPTVQAISDAHCLIDTRPG